MKEYTHKLNPKREWEILAAMNDVSRQDAVIKEFGNVSPINYLLSMNFNDRIKVDLPEGMPPYNRNIAVNSDFQGALMHVITRMKYCFVGSDIKKVKREHMFIEMLESIPPESADVLVHCKDKALHEMFPNITKELVAKYCPNLL